MTHSTGTDQAADEAPDPGPLARKLKRLIDLGRTSEGSKYTAEDIAEGMTALHLADEVQELWHRLADEGASQLQIETEIQELMRTHTYCHRTYLGKLLNGKTANPTMDRIEYLARFFGISAAYFLDDDREATRQVEAEVEQLSTLRDLQRVDPEGQFLVLARGMSGLTPTAATSVMKLALQALELATAQNGSEPTSGT